MQEFDKDSRLSPLPAAPHFSVPNVSVNSFAGSLTAIASPRPIHSRLFASIRGYPWPHSMPRPGPSLLFISRSDPNLLRLSLLGVRVRPTCSKGATRAAIVTNPAEILATIRQFRGPIQPQIRHSRSRLSFLGVRVCSCLKSPTASSRVTA